MTTATMRPSMAKAKPKTLSTKLHMDVIESARIVAAYRGELITDLLSDILRPVLLQMEREEMDRRTKSKANEAKKSGPK